MTPDYSGKIKVLVVDDIAETRENLRKLLSFAPDIEVIGAAGSGQEGIELVRQFEPDIVLMDINMPGMDGIMATEAIMQAVPMTQVVMLSVQGESDYLRRAMLAGARDFLTKPPSGDELMSTIRQVYETGKKRAEVIAPAHQVVTTRTTAEGSRGGREGKIIAVYSPKGGVGCTTVAVNLAIALQQLVGATQKVALIDANLQFGDVGVMLNLSASRSIADLADQIDEVDSDMLSSVMAPHPSGVKVLLAPPHPEAAESLLTSASDEGSNRTLKKILGLMRKEFDIIIIDTWSWVDEIALTIFDAAAIISLVVMPFIPSIKGARLFLEVAGKLKYPMEGIALVINGADYRGGFRPDQIEQALMPAAAQIPFDEPAVIDSANRGLPLVVRDQNRPVSQGVIKLAENLLERIQEAEEEEEEEIAESAAPGTGRLRLGRLFG